MLKWLILNSVFLIAIFFSDLIARDNQQMEFPFSLSQEEWQKKLSPEEYRILRLKGTERPFTGELLENKETGVYVCAGCGQELFKSNTKFNSGTGWPSFFQSIDSSITEIEDNSHGMTRVEIVCSNCGGHLGHVFPDGPAPTGLRYCVNSVSLDFEKDK